MKKFLSDALKFQWKTIIIIFCSYDVEQISLNVVDNLKSVMPTAT